MRILLDASVLVRLANTGDTQHATADAATRKLTARGEALVITPQAVIEFRAVATRPAAVNGLGLTAAECEAKVAGFEAEYPHLEDSPLVYPAWTGIVHALGVIGKTVHDARLVAVCHVHGVTHLLTFNVRHFTTLAAAPPGLGVLDPVTV